jgi:molecular chaperone Hsp33
MRKGVTRGNRTREFDLRAPPVDNAFKLAVNFFGINVTDNDDFLQRFSLERAHVNGVLVRLTESWQQVRNRADYPASIQTLLAKTLAASALLTGNIKFEGSLSIQLKGCVPLSLLFAECGDDGRVRGLARWTAEPTKNFRLTDGGSGAIMAITIENSTSGQRYQGLVPIEDPDLSVLFERYFERSEQLPTRIVLAADETRCAGIMLQQLPVDAGRETHADAWNRVGVLLSTLTMDELLSLPAEKLLLRLFHEESARAHAPRPLTFGCRCSRERVAGVLYSLGRDEAQAAVREDGFAEVTCEFCNTKYRFDRVDLEQLFRGGFDAGTSATSH